MIEGMELKKVKAYWQEYCNVMQLDDFRKKVMGCWLGKAVGGTLGQPYEGCNEPLNLSYYEPVPDDMIPNDDLDL